MCGERINGTNFAVEKIKTIGATYMVAAGLTPKAVYDGTDTDLDQYLCHICEFAFAMQECIKRINKHSFNNFQLRIGEWYGLTLIYRIC